MKERKISFLLLGISVVGFLTMSVSFCLMPQGTLGVLPGILFWVGLAAGLLMQVALELRRRAFYQRYGANMRRMQRPRNGLLSLCTDPMATAVDILTLASILATVIAMLVTKGEGLICYGLISLTVFAFCMHCVCNGRNVFFLKKYQKIQRVLEEKQVSNEEKGEGKK